MKRLNLVFIIICICVIFSSCSSGAEASGETSDNNTAVTETIAENSDTTQTAEVTTIAESTEIKTEPTTEEAKQDNSSWKKLYIDFLNTLKHEAYAGYKLVYIDDDDIPELLVVANSMVTPGYLCWANNDELCQDNIQMNWFYYNERENVYLTHSEFTGVGWDYVKEIDGSKAEKIAHGETNDIEGNEYYRWNDIDMSKSQYETERSNALNISTAQTADNLKSYSEICSEISQF